MEKINVNKIKLDEEFDLFGEQKSINVDSETYKKFMHFMDNKNNYLYFDNENLEKCKKTVNCDDNKQLPEIMVYNLMENENLKKTIKCAKNYDQDLNIEENINNMGLSTSEFGKKFERQFFEKLESEDKNLKYTLVGDKPKSGDILIENKGNKILYELKKYSNTVGNCEINKLKRDKANTGIKISIFVSTNKIVGRKKFDAEIIEKGFNAKLAKDKSDYIIKENSMIIFIDEFDIKKNFKQITKLNNYIFSNYELICGDIDSNNILNIIKYLKNIENEINYIYESDLFNKFNNMNSIKNMNEKSNFLFILENIYKLKFISFHSKNRNSDKINLNENEYNILERFQILKY